MQPGTGTDIHDWRRRLQRSPPLPLHTVESHIWMGKVFEDLKQEVALLVPLPSNIRVTLGAM
jgi:hypothetical protein